ncbi:biotin/lipoyl-containing protein [Trebonia sp.]|uniref:acetyl-CoA carboxylase biotin carboxyl carrier protein n=1 Tax=Trebonia sp. TaxID=2767075 RepID=UPI0026319021|nr:biotin/lipoyl-containing protein [Trebonia sp.]
MDLTNQDVADILAVLDSLPYDELDLQTPRFRLSLRRAPGGGWTQESQVVADPAVVSPAPNGASAAQPQPQAGRVAEADPSRDGQVPVNAPLPGTFYRAPRPGAAPFVEVGDQVTEDTVVAIVETMKLMNSVHAGTRGRVAQICLRNAETAAQGATLMWIAPEP